MSITGGTAVVSEVAEEASEEFARAFPSLRVSAMPSRLPFRFEYRTIATERFTISRLRCTGRLSASGALPESVSVGRRVLGQVRIDCGSRSIDTSRPYLRPVASADFELCDGEVMLISLDPAGVAEYVEHGGERGGLTSRSPTAPHLTALSLVMDHAGAVVENPDALTGGAREELHDLLCWSLLHAFADPWAETRHSSTRPVALRRALRHLAEHAGETVTMPEVAAAAGVSLRTLGTLFRHELDTTPHAWLRDLRLDRARLDLMTRAGTVAEIAARHGLVHPGRFAQSFLTRFGEHPGDVRRKASGGPRPEGAADHARSDE